MTFFAYTLQQLITEGLPATVIFAVVGMVLALVAYRLLDLITPGCLSREIFENRNVAAAILGGSLVLGICIIIAAAVAG